MGGGAREPMPHPPPSEPGRPGKSLWAEEALSKQRNAEWNLGDGGGEEGGGGAAEAARLPASLSVRPGELPPPPPQPGLRRWGRGRRLRSAAVFQFTFADPGRKGVRPFRCPAWLQCSQPRFPGPLCPGGLSGAEPAKVSQKAQSSRNLPRSCATRPPRPPRPSAPSARRARKLAHPPARSRELEPALVAPAAAPPRPRSRPGCSCSRCRVHPGNGFSKHTFVSTHAAGARTHTPRARAHSPAGC